MGTGVATGFLLHSMSEQYASSAHGAADEEFDPSSSSFLESGTIPFIVAGVAPLVTEQVSQKMIAVMDYYVPAAISDGIAGSPPNTKGSKGVGYKDPGKMWTTDKPSIFLERRKDDNDKGMSDSAKFPGLLGKQLQKDFKSYLKQLVKKMWLPMANQITFTLNATVPWAIRRQVSRDAARAAAGALFSIVSRTAYQSVVDSVLEKVPIYLAVALNNTLTNTLTRAITHSLTSTIEASFDPSSSARCLLCRLQHLRSPRCAACQHAAARRGEMAADAHNRAAYYSDYYAPNQVVGEGDDEESKK